MISILYLILKTTLNTVSIPSFIAQRCKKYIHYVEISNTKKEIKFLYQVIYHLQKRLDSQKKYIFFNNLALCSINLKLLRIFMMLGGVCFCMSSSLLHPLHKRCSKSSSLSRSHSTGSAWFH